MPKEKGNTSIQKARESRWRILIRNPRFFKDIERLQRALFRKGKINEKQVERVADKWGVPQIPWEVIMYCPPINDASYAPFLESCAYKFGLLRVSYEPLAAHRLSRNRFLTLMVDLEHPLDDLVELFKNEVRIVATTPRRGRKRLDKLDEYLPCWDHAQKGWTLREIAKEVYPQHWAELPKNVEELSIKPTQNEIKEKAKELRQKGQCGYDWSFKQAREDLEEEKLQLNKISAEALRKTFRERLKARRALRKKVWRNIQAAHRWIQDITPKTT